jgi:chromosome segregation ATPase
VALNEFTRDCEAVKFKYLELFSKCDELQERIDQMEERQRELQSSEGILSQMTALKERISSEFSSTLDVWKHRDDSYSLKFRQFEEISSRNSEEMERIAENLRMVSADMESLSVQIQDFRKEPNQRETSDSRKRKGRDFADSFASSKRPRLTMPDQEVSTSRKSLHPQNHPILSSLQPKTPRELLIHYTLLTLKCEEKDITFPLEVDHLNFDFHVRQLSKKRATKK